MIIIRIFSRKVGVSLCNFGVKVVSIKFNPENGVKIFSTTGVKVTRTMVLNFIL